MPIEIDTSYPEALLGNPWVQWGLGIIFLVFLFWVIVRGIRWSARQRSSVSQVFQKKILLVSVPREKEDDKQTATVVPWQQVQEKIAVMETFFSVIAGLKAEKGWRAWLLGRQDIFSLEIVCQKGQIYFYLAMPANLQAYVEEQIHAQFPQAFIEEMKDYDIFSPQSFVAAKLLKFQREYIFPLKTYKTFESDPLNAMVNALSKLSESEGAVIQIVIRSAPSEWHKWGVKVAAKLQQGKKLKEALKSTRGGAVSSFMRETSKLVGPTKEKSPEGPSNLSPLQTEMVKALEEKTSRAGVEANIRVVVSSDSQERLSLQLNNIIGAFNQYSLYQYGNSLKPTDRPLKRLVQDYIYRNFDEGRSMILNTEELASLYHFPIPFVNETPNIHWLQAKKAPAPLNVPAEGLFVGFNSYRGKKTPIRIKEDDRRRHMYIIGQTGTGKSWFMEGLAMQDIQAGKGVCFIDPHGDAIDHIMERIPKERAEDVILFDPTDMERPMALNMLEYDTPEQKTFAVNEMMNIFDKLYDLKTTGGPVFEQYFKNACYLIMDDMESGATLLEVPRVLSDAEFRKLKLSRCHLQFVKDFWEKEAQKAGGEASLQNMVPYISSKLTPFIANDFLRPIISQQKSSLNFRNVMDQKKVLLIKLSKGKLGGINANLLGLVIVGKILMAALARADRPEAERLDFYLYIDEFQNFLTESIETILSEARKYRLCLTMAHQYIGQLVRNNDTRFKDAIFGNVGTKVAFRIGVEDAELLTKEFSPVFSPYDFLNVPKYNCFMKLLIDNANPPGFNMATVPFSELPNVPAANPELAEAIRQLSRLKYGRDRAVVEAEVNERIRKFSALAPI